MADGINRVFLFGNLASDPEHRGTEGGQSVLSMRLATNESWLDREKQRQTRTEWHNVVLWGPRADALQRILRKGMAILVVGSLRTRTYEKDGVKRYIVEVNAKEICLGGRGDREGHGDEQGEAPRGGSAPHDGHSGGYSSGGRGFGGGGGRGGSSRQPPPPDDGYGPRPGDDEDMPF